MSENLSSLPPHFHLLNPKPLNFRHSHQANMVHFLHYSRRALLRGLPLLRSASPPLPSHPNRSMSHIAEMRKSAFRENLLRILRTEIDYEHELRHPREPAKEFGSFTVEDMPGRQYLQLRKRHGGGDEDVKVDVTMFDGFVSSSPDAKADDPGGDVKLHLSLVVDVVKSSGGGRVLQFVCSAWPDSLIIQKVFVYRRSPPPLRPFMGPDFKELDEELQEAMMAYLGERGIDDELAAFLHDYVANKDVCEHIRWMGNIKSYVEM